MSLAHVTQYLEKIEETVEFLNNTESIFKNLESKLSMIDKEQEDLLHELELSNLSGVKMVQLAAKLKQVRKERREIKQEYTTLMLIKNFMKEKNNINKDLEKLKNTLCSTIRKMETKTYKPRVLTDLEYGGKKRKDKVDKNTKLSDDYYIDAFAKGEL